MPDIKFSEFPSTSSTLPGDVVVGLHSGANEQFLVSASPTATGIVLWDASKNITANSFLSGYTTTATAATTTVLTVASTQQQYFTGSTTQTVTLPVTSTLVLGQSFTIVNNSSGVVTVNSSGGNTIQAMAASSSLRVTCILTSGTSAASWNAVYSASGGGVLSATGTANQVLVNGTSGSAQTGALTFTLPQSIATASSPTFAGLTLSSALTVPNGGTGLATLTAYTLLAGGTTATGNLQQVSAGSAGQLLQSNGASSLPSWTTSTFPSGSGTLNHMLRSDGTNWVQTTSTTLTSGDVLAGVTSATIGDINIAGSSLISTTSNENIVITPNGSGAVLMGLGTPVNVSAGFFAQITNNLSTGNSLLVGSFDNLPVSGAIYGALKSRSTVVNSFVALQTSDVIGGFVGYGDTGFTYRSCGGMILACAASPSSGIMPTQLTFSTQNVSGSTTTALTISDAQIVTLANPLPVGSGGLGITSTPTNGQIPIGNGTNYVAATLTAGSGISVTNGSGSITLASTGNGAWVDQTTSSVTMAVNTGYTSDDGASLVTFTLPTTSAIGDYVEVVYKGSGGWTIVYGTGQSIQFGTVTTTTTTGSLSSLDVGSCVKLRCSTANTLWTVVSVVGNLTTV